MEDEFIRKCVPRDKKGERWNVELPIGWVKEIDLQNSRLRLKRIGNSIMITKVGETESCENSKVQPVEPSSMDDEDRRETENRVKGVARWVY